MEVLVERLHPAVPCLDREPAAHALGGEQLVPICVTQRGQRGGSGTEEGQDSGCVGSRLQTKAQWADVSEKFLCISEPYVTSAVSERTGSRFSQKGRPFSPFPQ